MNFENALGPWMGRTMKMLDYYYQDVFKESNFNLTKNQWLLLKILIEDDGKPQNELAFITNRDKASLTRLISVMEKKNLVERISSKEDKRIKYIFTTQKGKQTFEDTLPLVKKVLKTIQGGLSEEEIEKTIEVMKKIQSNITNKSSRCIIG